MSDLVRHPVHRALARPQIGESRSEIEASGIDMMLVIDVSGSMRAMDFRMGGDPG